MSKNLIDFLSQSIPVPKIQENSSIAISVDKQKISKPTKEENVDARGLNGPLRSVSTTRVHGPSSRAELTARELGCIFWHPSTRAVNSGSGNRTPVYTGRVHGRPVTPVYTGVRFPLPEFTARVDGCQKNAPEFSGRQLGPSTRPVNSGSGNRP